METKINILEILKDKPINTKLYDLVRNINVYLTNNPDSCNRVYCTFVKNGIQKLGYSSKGTLVGFENGMIVLAPSKSMQDWSKFAWKKGDVLVSKGRRILHVIFEGFNDDTYTTFKGKHYLCDYSDKEDYDEEYYNDYHKEVNERTIEFEKDNVNNAQTYINIIEKRLGGKLNRETLEIEKWTEFKDKDIIVTDALYSLGYSKCILILKGDLNTNDSSVNSYVFYNVNNDKIHFNVLDENIRRRNIHPATEEEKQQLFDALAKENKAWDAEKKQVVDLKPKVVFKPFDKVLVRDNKSDSWRANLFSNINNDGRYRCVSATWTYCIPYEGNESLLGTTKDVEG